MLSDLHLSQGGLPAPSVDADLVVLAGDVARPAQAVEWAKSLRTPVLYVPGNHEFYGGSLPGTVRELKRLTQGSHVHVLDDEEIQFGSVRFLGCTLWTDFRLASDAEGRELARREALERVHDFRRIHVDEERQTLFTPDHSERLFQRSAAWLEAKLATAWPAPTVVITHHAPSERSVAPQFSGSPLNACFASHLDRLLGRRFAGTWIHGHMHHSVDLDHEVHVELGVLVASVAGLAARVAHDPRAIGVVGQLRREFVSCFDGHRARQDAFDAQGTGLLLAGSSVTRGATAAPLAADLRRGRRTASQRKQLFVAGCGTDASGWK